MSEMNANNGRNPETEQKVELVGKLDAAGWGLFFIWVGIALLTDIGWGVGLLGVGVITLAGQAARRYFGLAVESFWAAVGVLFVLGGLWELFAMTVSLVPILLLGAGIGLLASIVRGKRKQA